MKKKKAARRVPRVQPVQTTSRPVRAETSYRELQGKPFKV
jgi:hypothetical protein